jgi:phage shock protein A
MFRRLANLVKGFFSLFIAGIEKRKPEALLEVEKEHLREQIAKYNQGLASHAGLAERLMSQVRKLEAEERELKAKASANLRAGNRDAAGQYALRLQTVTRELEENRRQLEQAEQTYKNLVRARDQAVNAAKAKIEALKASINDLKLQRANAELTEMASGMVSEIGGSGDTLDRLHEMVEEERQIVAGKARMARDTLMTADTQLQEAEQAALAEQALADFAAQEGITLGGPGAAEAKETGTTGTHNKSMGPVTEVPQK